MHGDWNDLARQHGKREAKRQLEEGLKQALAANDAPAESPKPSDNGGPESGAVSIVDFSEALKRFAWTVPEGRIWDNQTHKLLKEKQVRDWIGPEVFKAWKESDKRRTVQHADVARKASAAQKKGGGGVRYGVAAVCAALSLPECLGP